LEGESIHLFFLLALTNSYRTLFESPPVDGATLRDVFIKYGRSARHCYKLAKDPVERDAWEQSIPMTFRSNLAGNDLDHNSERILKASSQLITILPNEDRRPQVELVSKHVALHLFAIIDEHRAENFWEYFDQFWSVRRSRPTAGWLWESHVLRRELLGKEIRHVPLQSLPLTQSQSSSLGIDLPFSSVVRFGTVEALAKQLARVIPTLFSRNSTRQKILFVPAIPNQATLDAFSISHGGLIELYQVTSARKHPLRASGFDFLWDALILAQDELDSRYYSKINQLLPSKTRPWRVIFAIPRRVHRIWKKPQQIDFGDLKPRRKWTSYIKQLRMVLEDRSKGEETVVTGVDREGGEEELQFDGEVGPTTGKGEIKSQSKRRGQKRTRAAAKVDEDGEEEQSRKSPKRQAVGVSKANAMAKTGGRVNTRHGRAK
jgi:hypothetical protein